jgi:hypothetical protein
MECLANQVPRANQANRAQTESQDLKGLRARMVRLVMMESVATLVLLENQVREAMKVSPANLEREVPQEPKVRLAHMVTWVHLEVKGLEVQSASQV